MSAAPAAPILDTFPRYLLHHAEVRGSHPATREKDLGSGQTWTWSQVRDEVRALACGLASLGFQRGMNLAIIGDNPPRLYWAMAAAQSLGGVPVPLYQDAVAEEMVYVLNDAEVHFAIVEDQEQVDKLLEIRETVPLVKRIIYEDPRGLRNYDQPGLASYEQIRALGLIVLAVLSSGAGLAQSESGYKMHDWNRPRPPVVDPGTPGSQEAPGKAPSDATVLFDGKDLTQWCAMDGSPTKWVNKDGVMECVAGSGMIRTFQNFGDCQLHVEWSTPALRSERARDEATAGSS